jgi:hypothetical protein
VLLRVRRQGAPGGHRRRGAVRKLLEKWTPTFSDAD